MEISYKTKGTCSQQINFELNGDIVTNVRIIGGCNGNGKGMAAMAEGRKAEDIISRCMGITCGMKGTSCPDQLAKAVKEALSRQQAEKAEA